MRFFKEILNFCKKQKLVNFSVAFLVEFVYFCGISSNKSSNVLRQLSHKRTLR